MNQAVKNKYKAYRNLYLALQKPHVKELLAINPIMEKLAEDGNWEAFNDIIQENKLTREHMIKKLKEAGYRLTGHETKQELLTLWQRNAHT